MPARKLTAKELELDYFRIYKVKIIKPKEDVDMELQGQFDNGVPKKFLLGNLEYFAVRAAKEAEPLHDKNAHLTWYSGKQSRVEMRRVVRVWVDNQFGSTELRLKYDENAKDAPGLLVPTEKIERLSAFPETLDHYKLYKVQEGAKFDQRTLRLKDQFLSDTVVLGMPKWFAVPVHKRRGKEEHVIQNRRGAHLVIYDITPQSELRKELTLSNQFGKKIKVSLMQSVMLAAPSRKIRWNPEQPR